MRLLLLVLLFAGFGCAARQTAQFELPTAPPPAGSPYYIAYTEEQYLQAKAEGRPILLYFWASWCPICRVEEPKTRMIVEAMDVPVAGFRVNFDTETALKQQFRVTYQHTTVILNAKGEESARFTGPVADGELAAAIRAAAQ